MGSGRGQLKRVQTKSAAGSSVVGRPTTLEERLQKKTFYANDGKKFVVFGAGLVDEKTIEQMRGAMNSEVVRLGSLQADGHYGYSAPIGAVLGMDNAVSPVSVGYDQACGMRAAQLNVQFSEIKDDLASYLHEMQRVIPIGLGKTHEKPIDHEIFNRPEWDEEPLASMETRDGGLFEDFCRKVLGSAGAGNHFYSIVEAEDGTAWSLIHFGSRSPGYKLAEYFIALADKEQPEVAKTTGLTWLTMESDAGQAYWQMHQFARDFAYAGRDHVGAKMAEILGTTEKFVVHNHHNHAEIEEHEGQKLYVHRKGATPANVDEWGIIPGSMGDSSYVVQGLGNEESLRSSSHGAGRVMSRNAAHGKWDKKKGDWRIAPRVTRGAMDAWLKKEGVIVLGGDLDESPHVYKRIDEVMGAQTELVKAIVKLSPRGVVMAPPDRRKAKMRGGGKPLNA